MLQRYGAGAGRTLQVVERLGAFRIDAMVTTAALSREGAESDHSPLCSLWSKNKHGKFLWISLPAICTGGPCELLNEVRLTYRPTPSSLAWWLEQRGSGRCQQPTRQQHGLSHSTDPLIFEKIILNLFSCRRNGFTLGHCSLPSSTFLVTKETDSKDYTDWVQPNTLRTQQR